MIISEIKGGLGNQLFQYAFGKCLATLNSCELKLDVHFFDSIRAGVTPRQFLLRSFNIDESIATLQEIEKLRKNKTARKIFPYSATYIKDSGKPFSKKYFKPNQNRYLTGYWQSEQYFKPIESELRKILTLENIPTNQSVIDLLQKIESTNSVSIHFRRTDYVGKSLGAVCSQTYYDKAVETIKHLQGLDIHLFIFSDDSEWVKQNIAYSVPYTVVDQIATVDNCVLDLYLMSKCKHNIIANSSFSWWGAWLNVNSEKKVICPMIWEQGRSVDSIIPQSWIKNPII